MFKSIVISIVLFFLYQLNSSAFIFMAGSPPSEEPPATPIHDLKLEETSGSSYVVANDGTGAGWTASVYPINYYSTTHAEGSYSANLTGVENIYSTDVWTSDTIDIKMWLRRQYWNDSYVWMYFFEIGDGDGNTETNEMWFVAHNTDAAICIVYQAAGGQRERCTQDMGLTDNTWYAFHLTMDCAQSGWDTFLEYGTTESYGSTATWNAWSTTPENPTFSSVVRLGDPNAFNEPINYIDHFRMDDE